MAGSRSEKLGTIFTRINGLIRSNALKEEEIPLWYNVYKAFPPKYEPSYTRPAVKKEIAQILYAEDAIRGQFYQTYGSPGLFDIQREHSKSLLERFVERYQELEKHGYENTTDLFKLTEESLASEGIILKRRPPLIEHPRKSEGYGEPLSGRRMLETIKISMVENFTDKKEV